MGTGFGTCAAVSVGMDNIYVILKPTMVTFFAVIFLALIFIGAMMLGISFRFTTVKTLADNLQAFGKKVDVRMEDSSISEIHEISVIFNEMAERIQYLIEQVMKKSFLQPGHRQNTFRHRSIRIFSLISLPCSASVPDWPEMRNCIKGCRLPD